jgi:hypothetical protein
MPGFWIAVFGGIVEIKFGLMRAALGHGRCRAFRLF